jgi:cell division septation protein DedD
MSMMLTFRAGKLASLLVSLAILSACSREQQDWRSAEAADTVEGYGQFLQRHPESELATEARTRVAQLSEDLEWQRAGSADNADAYRQFLAQHPNGKWAQEARIRIENFALGREGSAAAPVSGAADTPVAGTAIAHAPVSGPVQAAAPGGTSSGDVGPRAYPGEAAQVFPGEAGRAQAPQAQASAQGELARAPTSAQVSPGELARAPTSVAPGELTRMPTPAQVLATGASAQPTSTPASPAIATAWRSDDGFGVQLGAFASESAATNEWQQLTARFSAELRGLAPRVVSANTATGQLFRLQALVADEARARALCDMLKKQSQACVPVLPH